MGTVYLLNTPLYPDALATKMLNTRFRTHYTGYYSMPYAFLSSHSLSGLH